MRYLFFLLLSLPALSQEPLKYPLLKKTIDSLALIDQKVQQDFIDSFKTGQSKKFEQIKEETFIRHMPILKQIFHAYGFPTYDLVGKKSSNNYWLCVQHCDQDLSFQQGILAAMEPHVKAKQADPRNFAYLTDRVNINSGKPQIYGTQVTYKDRTAITKYLADPTHVNQKRLANGLDSLEAYLRMMTSMHRQINPN